MLIYHGKRFTSAIAGKTFAEVECDKCGCHYGYELARVGSGSSTSHYWIGQSTAKTTSAQRAHQDMGDRLAREAELVPCPKCHWISEDLVRGYRLGRMRHLGNLAIAIAFVGTCVSLIAAWFIFLGPATDRQMARYVVFGGPVVSISLAATMLLIRYWLRSRIQPNRDYPLVPKVPAGTPPALVYDEGSGMLRAAQADRRAFDTSEPISFQVGRQQLPNVCCDCLRPATTGSVYKYTVTEAVSLRVSRCTECAKRKKRRSVSAYLTSFVTMNAAATVALLVMRLGPDAFWLLLVGCLLVSFALAAWVASAVTSPVRIRIADRSRLALYLRFRNPEYHRYVAEQLSREAVGQGYEKESQA